MPEPYYTDEQVTLHHGDALTVARELPTGAADCIVTSPPYFGLRDYGADGQYGLETTPAEYVERMRGLFAELRRVLADDGTLWLNIGDSYYSGRGNPGPNADDRKNQSRRGWTRPLDRPGATWAKPKELLGVPWRVITAMRADGWRLRSTVIWHRIHGLPEPTAKDRPDNDFEYVFLLAKSRNYWFDPQVAKLGSVWPFEVKRSNGHPAPMPLPLAVRCVTGGCKPGGTVLDPFNGGGTTGLAAQLTGHRYIGIDINREYLELTLNTRLREATLDFEAGA